MEARPDSSSGQRPGLDIRPARDPERAPSPASDRWRSRPALASLRLLLATLTIVVIDFLLAWFIPWKGGGVLSTGHGGVAGLANATLGPVFLLAAAGEIAALAIWQRRSFPRIGLLLSSTQILLLLLTPTLFGVTGWERWTALAGSAVLIAAFAFLLQWVYRHKEIASHTAQYIVEWTLAATCTAAGWLVWQLDGTAVLLIPAILVQFVVAVRGAVPTPRLRTESRVAWLLHPFWAFQLLLFVFLGEFFVGALLDFELAGPSFLGYIPFVPLSGTGWGQAGAATYDGLWFSAAIMASAWFLVGIGVTMGTLVVLRMREVHVPAQRYRMGLMLGVYALAAVYIPSLASSTPLASSPALANLPIVGWGFGLRAGGPFESGVFLAVLVMYALVGVLTVLFGRKALCSVMCGAAMMYQGTTVNEMRRFNQTSRVGRYFLGSQLSTAYTVASSLALVSLFAVSALDFFQLLPRVQVANGMWDTAALPLPVELYFGGLWFAMFVATPYIGTYSCATTGFCHWGALSLPFAKVGFFRLKVRDKKVCQQCTTFDCAKACPVGLVDMPLYFRTTGEYRSTKCCGVGDCVGACPYGNMYHQDVRFWLRRKLSRPRPAPRGTPLPMVAAGKIPVRPAADPSATLPRA